MGVIALKIYLIAAASGAVDPESQSSEVILLLFENIIGINLMLMWFNLLPITPLDGSKVLLANIPGHSRTMPFWRAFEQHGPILLLILLISGGLFWILKWPMMISYDLIIRFLF